MKAGRSTRTAIAIIALVVALTAATVFLPPRPGIAGSPLAAERIDTGFAGALPIDDITPRMVAQPSDDPAVSAVITDLTAYWDQALPNYFKVQMNPLRGGIQAVDPSAPAFIASKRALCITSPAQIAGNAYYCPGVDGLMFDSGGLIPVLLGHYGVAGLIGAFGHEYGHVIQVRVGPAAAGSPPDPRRYPSIIVEEAADCYSGVFLNWVTTGHAPHLHLPRGALVRALAPLLDFRDPIDLPVDDPIAHGLALDRLQAVLAGLRTGPTACQAMNANNVQQTLGRPHVTTADKIPRFPSEQTVLTAARKSVSQFVIAELPGDVKGLNAITATVPRADDLNQARPFGQFAVAAAQAMALGRRITGNNTGAACFTGAWTASVFGTAPAGGLGSWAGDADEALDYLRATPHAGIEQLAAYADGFRTGPNNCH